MTPKFSFETRFSILTHRPVWKSIQEMHAVLENYGKYASRATIYRVFKEEDQRKIGVSKKPRILPKHMFEKQCQQSGEND